MTPLEALIREEIAARGPMRIDRYMALCLSHPDHGYYITRDPFGRGGDFVTAPEITQMFGELCGLWLAQFWLGMGAPSEIRLTELGPGRGTLMSDALRAAKAVPGFLKAAEVVLVETSPVLRAAQKQALRSHNVRWVETLEELDNKPVLFLANEFFDALPIRQFQKIGDIWMERLVGLHENVLTFVFGKTEQRGLSPSAPDGAIVERSAAQTRIIEQLGDQIAVCGGGALIFDYGDVDGRGDTLQAVSNQTYRPLLERPGEVDLTTHVDFGQLAGGVGNCAAHLTTQGQFLKAMGIDARAAALGKGKDNNARALIDAAVDRLTGEDQMGKLFKALAITQLDAGTPAGF